MSAREDTKQFMLIILSVIGAPLAIPIYIFKLSPMLNLVLGLTDLFLFIVCMIMLGTMSNSKDISTLCGLMFPGLLFTGLGAFGGLAKGIVGLYHLNMVNTFSRS